MKTTEHLYGCFPQDFMNLPYIEALHYKLDQAELLITVLLKPHFTKRDEGRLREVIQARTHNRNLLEEIGSTT